MSHDVCSRWISDKKKLISVLCQSYISCFLSCTLQSTILYPRCTQKYIFLVGIIFLGLATYIYSHINAFQAINKHKQLLEYLAPPNRLLCTLCVISQSGPQSERFSSPARSGGNWEAAWVYTTWSQRAAPATGLQAHCATLGIRSSGVIPLIGQSHTGQHHRGII